MELPSVAKAFSIFLVMVLSISSKELPQKHKSLSSLYSKEQSQDVLQISQKVTVRLISQYLLGSGVIVGYQNQKYSVLTCAHVLASKNIREFRALTSDGQLHPIEKNGALNFGKLDLALVSFRSDRSYAMVKPAQLNAVPVGSSVYVSGFPNYQYRDRDWQDTFKLGVKAFYLAGGQVILSLKQPMEEGYQMGLSNDIERGMSGGPVLNSQGNLVGIVGRAKYASAGIDAYRFMNGTYPSESLLEEMEAASWAIPVSQFFKVFRN